MSVSNVDNFNHTRSDLDKTTSAAARLYLFDNGVAPYVSYSTAFTPTSFADEQGNILDPMKGKQWEAGVKYEPEGMNSQFSASVFRINQKNIATKEEPTDPYRSIGEIESEGVELEAIGQLTDSLRMQAAYTTRIFAIRRAARKRRASAPSMPRVTWPAPAELRRQNRPAGRPDRRLRGALCQRIASDRQNTHTLPSYTLVDMVVGYDLSKMGLTGVSAQLNVNNLTDKSYVAACNSLSYCYFGAERSIVGSVSWKF